VQRRGLNVIPVAPLAPTLAPVATLAPTPAPVATPAAPTPQLDNPYHTHMNNAVLLLTQITRALTSLTTAETIERNNILACYAGIHLFCNEVNDALRRRTAENEQPFHTTPLALLGQLSIQIEILNGVVDRVGNPLNTRVRVLFENNRFTPTFKNTASYLKKLVLVHDLTVSKDADSCDCPICFDEVSRPDAIITNCNHSYCATCIKQFVSRINDKKPSCPMCRTEITQLTMGKSEVYNEISEHLSNF
jgi:hypothetical protein